MTLPKISRSVAQVAGDFLAGLVLFAALVAPGLAGSPEPGTGWLSNAAHARYDLLDPTFDIIDAGMAVPVPPEWITFQPQVAALMSLALAFATLFAVNLWFARHVRRAHAAYRRRR